MLRRARPKSSQMSTDFISSGENDVPYGVSTCCGECSLRLWVGCCQTVHLLTSSKVPTSSGTSSSSSSAAWAFPSTPAPICSLRNWYCCGPTCLRMSGIISLRLLVSGAPDTTKRFSLTEKEATTNTSRLASLGAKARRKIRNCQLLLTLWLSEMDNSVIILEHVHLVNVLQLLHS